QFQPNPQSAMLWRFGGKDKAKERLFQGLYSSVAVQDGLVLAPDQEGYLHCLDARTGKHYWVHDVKAELLSAPLIVDGKVYLPTTNGDVIILALAKERKVLREIDVDDSVDTSPVFANGVLYLATARTLYAIENRVP